MNDNVGFFDATARAGGTVLHVGGVGIPYGITENAENRIWRRSSSTSSSRSERWS